MSVSEHGVRELAQWFAADRLPDKHFELPSGALEAVPRLLREETRHIEQIPRTSSCWAPNKPALDLDGRSTFAEFILVELLMRHGWEARWIKNWSGGREFCAAVGQPSPMPKQAAAMFHRIDRRAASTTGGGAWDIWAWRGGEYMALESKQHRSGDSLRPGQRAWLEAGIDEGLICYAIVEYSAPRLAGAVTSPRSRPTSRRTSPAVDLPDGLAQILAEAALASPGTRIEFRDPIASYGEVAVEPLLEFASERSLRAFVVTVLERIGHEHRAQAIAGLKRLAALDPSIGDLARSALRRLSLGQGPAPNPAVGQRRSGVLDPSYKAASPKGTHCSFTTLQGNPCPNPATRWVDGRWSCSRDHPRKE